MFIQHAIVTIGSLLVHMVGLTNVCPGAEDVEPVIANTSIVTKMGTRENKKGL